MMGTQAAPERLFYDFCLEDGVVTLTRWLRLDRCTAKPTSTP